MEPMNSPQFNPQPMYNNANIPPPMGGQGDDGGQIEDLIEAVIEEKWKEIEANMLKVISWKDKTEQRLAQIEQSIADVKEEFSGLQNAVVGKVGEYDKHVVSIASQLQAMEKAFSQVLPTFIENIQELDRITKDMKRSDDE